MEWEPLNLAEFEISKTGGFLFDDPLEVLPSYFEKWNYIAKNVVNLEETGKLRDEIDKLEVLDASRLETPNQKRLAHMQLSMMTAGYLVQDQHIPQKIPRGLAIPYWNVSNDLAYPPTTTYTDVVLANGRKKNPDGTESCFYPNRGGQEAADFVLISRDVETAFAPAIPYADIALQCVSNKNDEGLIEALTHITNALRGMKTAVAQMHGRLTPYTFYNAILPHLSGWGFPGSPCPDGLLFEGVSDTPVKAISASAAQTSIIQVVDAVLGIHHPPDKREFFLSQRNHMPPQHRKFIDALEGGPSVREYVESSSSGSLHAAYKRCVQAETEWRSYHIQLVVKFINIPCIREKQDDLPRGFPNVIPKLQGFRAETKNTKDATR